MAGAEFGMNNIPGAFGRDYTFNSENTFRYFSERKLGLMRIPVLWERLQPSLKGPLDGAYLEKLKQNVAWAKAQGAEVIIDLHNFGRYSKNENGSLKTYVIDNLAADGTVKVSTADLVDLWIKVSNEFKFERVVYAYDLMNEPHDMGAANWKTTSQAVLNAIRASQDDKLILIPGDSWSSGNRWVTTHGPFGWIEDPVNNYAYEAHQYFDRDESGNYLTSYDAELARDSNLPQAGRTRIAHFIEWCRVNRVRGVVDEFGIPDGDSRWRQVLDNFLAAIDEAGMDGAYWAAGEWWGSYPLSVQPTGGFTTDRPQMTTLRAHASAGYLTALSAASISIARASAGSLVAIYGNGFSDTTGSASTTPYPLTIGDVAVQVTDAAGVSAPASAVYVSPNQVNVQVPLSMAAGPAHIAVHHAGVQVASGSIQIADSAPSIFTANAAGYGLPAAQILRVRADGTQTYEPVVQFDAARNAPIAVPVEFGAASDRLFLLLYGTGIREKPSVARIGQTAMPVLYAGPQGQYPGLDQVNVEVSRSLAGAGQVDITLESGGSVANTVQIVFR